MGVGAGAGTETVSIGLNFVASPSAYLIMVLDCTWLRWQANPMAVHCECIQVTFPGKLFEKLIKEFLHFVGNQFLSPKDESSFGSHKLCRFNTVKDSTTIHIFQTRNHLDKGHHIVVVYVVPFSFESANSDN